MPSESEQFEKEKTILRKPLIAKLKKAKKRLETFQLAQIEGEKWNEEAHTAQLLQSSFYKIKKGMEEIELEDWEKGEKVHIVLDPRQDPAKQLEKRFKRSQKNKRKLDASTKLIAIAQEEIKALENRLSVLESAKTFEELSSFQKASLKAKSATVKKEHPFREFTTQSGCKIFAGKNAEENDKLTFSFAKGSDTWLHASEVGGSHVILRANKGMEIDDDSLMDAVQIALYFSKAKNRGEGEVTVTECKYVKKSKRAKKGEVMVSSYKRVYARLDPSRLNRLFAKLLPGQAPL